MWSNMLPIMVTFGKVKKNTFLKYLQFHIFTVDKVRPKKNELHVQTVFTFFIQWNNEAKSSQI